MALILNIDTALETASVCIAKNGNTISIEKNTEQKDHAAWIHIAIQRSCSNAGISISSLDAIGVTIGPGSYTGLRVGLATAKGICFATDKPLITCSTLFNMALSVSKATTVLLCPMIDARRMEVYASMYRSTGLDEFLSPMPVILTSSTFEHELKANTITFFGNGSKKFKTICNNTNAVFRDVDTDASSMSKYIDAQFSAKQFADLAYTEPMYLKEFHTKRQ
jgi:tRNA threonylcarbamoyladenosine biosynthesis protein TsaB